MSKKESAQANRDLYYMLNEYTTSIKTISIEEYIDKDLKILTVEELANTKVTEANFGEVMFVKKLRQYAMDKNVVFRGMSMADKIALDKIINKIPLCQAVTTVEDTDL